MINQTLSNWLCNRVAALALPLFPQFCSSDLLRASAACEQQKASGTCKASRAKPGSTVLPLEEKDVVCTPMDRARSSDPVSTMRSEAYIQKLRVFLRIL